MLKRLEKILNGFYTTQVWTKVELCGSCYLHHLCERNGLKALILRGTSAISAGKQA